MNPGMARLTQLIAALTLIIPGLLTDAVGLGIGGTIMAICMMKHRKDSATSSAT